MGRSSHNARRAEICARKRVLSTSSVLIAHAFRRGADTNLARCASRSWCYGGSVETRPAVALLVLCARCGASNVWSRTSDAADEAQTFDDASTFSDISDESRSDTTTLDDTAAARSTNDAVDGAAGCVLDAPIRASTILADASVDDVAAPTDGPYVVELAVALPLHQSARLSDGTVRCRGANDLGQLGLGMSGTPSLDAVTVPWLSDVEQVMACDACRILVVSRRTQSHGWSQLGQRFVHRHRRRIDRACADILERDARPIALASEHAHRARETA